MSILFPGSGAPLTEQYKKAWADLMAPSKFDRAHAKCWLTYRAVEGEITVLDWLKHVSPCEIPDIGTRWLVSQATAEFFLWSLHGLPGCPDRDRAEDLILQANYKEWPDGLAHYCRVASILALEYYIKGDHPQDHPGACAIMETAINMWQRYMGEFDFKKHPNRFLECRYDLHAINFMVWLGGHLGMLKTSEALNQWIPDSLKTQKNTPWWRCIEKVMDGQSGIWLPRLTPFKTDPLIRTRQDLALVLFNGVGAELGVAGGVFSADILANCANVWRLYSIDRWNDHHGVDEWFKAINLLRKFTDGNEPRSIILRASFSEVIGHWEDGTFDFLYIDSYAHTGQDNGKTLADWWPKLKPNGVFSGHDYSPRYQPTVDAVDAFVKKHDLQLMLTTDDELPSWYVVKPG